MRLLSKRERKRAAAAAASTAAAAPPGAAKQHYTTHLYKHHALYTVLNPWTRMQSSLLARVKNHACSLTGLPGCSHQNQPRALHALLHRRELLPYIPQ